MTEVVVEKSGIGDVGGKVAIVTGGASGIGKAIVQLLHELGAIVVFCDLNVSAGQQIEKQLGSRVDFLKCNVVVWKELLDVFRHAKKTYGHVDLVFANAGIGGAMGAFEDKLDENGELAEPDLLVIDVNLKSVILTSKLALSYFKSNNPPGGGLVMTCSTSGYNERPNLPLYSAAKHGVAGLMRALRHGAPTSGVSVSAVAPGGTETPMLDPTATAGFKALGIPLQPPEYVALAAVFLASNPEWNGKALTLIGSRATEVEAALTETQPLWYGKYNLEMAAKAAAVTFGRT